MFNSTLLLICILLGSEESQAYLKRSSHIQIENTEVVINQVFTDSTADIHYLTVQKNKLNFVDGQKIQIFSFTTDILKVSSSDNGQYFAVVTRPQNLVKESGLDNKLNICKHCHGKGFIIKYDCRECYNTGLIKKKAQ